MGDLSLGGERAIANFDEDSLTMAVNASVDALGDRDPQSLAGVFFASTTSPYREKQAAVTVATVLEAGPEIRTIDFTDSLRAGTSALLTALDLVPPGKTCSCALGIPAWVSRIPNRNKIMVMLAEPFRWDRECHR